MADERLTDLPVFNTFFIIEKYRFIIKTTREFEEA